MHGFEKGYTPWNKGMKHAYSLPSMKGEKSPAWKGGIRRVKGYIRIYQPTHPNADRYGCVLEHRLVVEKNLGRYLTPDEVVHHINGKTEDNRLENLELLTRNGHALKHGIGKGLTIECPKCKYHFVWRNWNENC